MATVAFISHSDCGRHDTGWEHPEHVGRLRAITRALRETPELFMALDHREGRHATPAELALAHDPDYVERVRAMAGSGGGLLDTDTVVSEGSWDAAIAGVGCVLDAVDLAMRGEVVRSFCGVRPPGHHALRDSGMGFCLFGNVAVAAHHARRHHGAERVLVLDWDVHHGNGTQALVEHDPGIRFVSMHQWPWYPGSGAAEDRGPHGSVWNVPMAAGLAAAEYETAWESAVDAATAGWRPEIVLLSAGFDCLAGDPLGGFTLEPAHIGAMTRRLVQRAGEWCDGRLVSALEGGYAPPALGAACVMHMQALL
ncbi:MAG: histone deacetylase family protein [Gemmatimonadaceae bacterium]